MVTTLTYNFCRSRNLHYLFGVIWRHIHRFFVENTKNRHCHNLYD